MLIIASKPGQLGNRLFLFAQFIGCARENRLTVMNPAFDDYADLFETTSRDLFCRYPARTSTLPPNPAARRLLYRLCYYAARVILRSGLNLPGVRAVALDWDETLELGSPAFLSTLKPRQLLLLQGWLFRDERAVTRHADAIREFLAPRAEFQRNVSALVTRARAGADLLVGLHIRHGDYRTYRGGKYFYELETYADVMRKVEALSPERRVAFLVCSNAEHDAQLFAPFRYTSGSGHLIEDMYALAACDYIVGPPSTYTMWASFYGQAPLYIVEDPRRTPQLADFFVYNVEGTGAGRADMTTVNGVDDAGASAASLDRSETATRERIAR